MNVRRALLPRLPGLRAGSARIPSRGRTQGVRRAPNWAALQHPGSSAAVDAGALAIGEEAVAGGVPPGAAAGRLYEGGLVVNSVGAVGVRVLSWVDLCERRSSLYRLLSGRTRRHWRPASGGAIPKGPSGGQTSCGASRSRSGCKGLIVGEHVPDRLGELAGDVDLGDPGAALAPEALLVALVAL